MEHIGLSRLWRDWGLARGHSTERARFSVVVVCFVFVMVSWRSYVFEGEEGI